eukprot:Gb_06950 [translate_table: standard]
MTGMLVRNENYTVLGRLEDSGWGKSSRTELLHFGHLGSARDNITYMRHLGHPTSTIVGADVDSVVCPLFFKLSVPVLHEPVLDLSVTSDETQDDGEEYDEDAEGEIIEEMLEDSEIALESLFPRQLLLATACPSSSALIVCKLRSFDAVRFNLSSNLPSWSHARWESLPFF